MTSVSASREIAAPPERVFALVSELSRMGEWSPENTGGEWKKGSTGPSLGARFTGKNRNGKKTWSTNCHVVECVPPTRFAFDVTAGPFKVARWQYVIEPTSSGCAVTETWIDQRNGLTKKLGKAFSGVEDREGFTKTSIEHTLERLEASATS